MTNMTAREALVEYGLNFDMTKTPVFVPSRAMVGHVRPIHLDTHLVKLRR